MATNPYLTADELKDEYLPKQILNALADNDGDGLVDDDVIQRFIDDAPEYIRGINPDVSDGLMKPFSADYVNMRLYFRFGLTKQSNDLRLQLLDALGRTTGVDSQKTANENTPATSEVSSSTFTSSEFEKW